MSERSDIESSRSLTFEAALARVDEALARGDVQRAHALAEELHRGMSRRDDASGAEAQVVLRLAYGDYHMSHMQRALEGAALAARRFRKLSMRGDEVEALSLWSRAAGRQGRSVEAVEAALLATRLAEGLPAADELDLVPVRAPSRVCDSRRDSRRDSRPASRRQIRGSLEPRTPPERLVAVPHLG